MKSKFDLIEKFEELYVESEEILSKRANEVGKELCSKKPFATIIFSAVIHAYQVTQSSFKNYKCRVRAQFANQLSYEGEEECDTYFTIEKFNDNVQKYIEKYAFDHLSYSGISDEVVRQISILNGICLHILLGDKYSNLIDSFIYKCCQLFWMMALQTENFELTVPTNDDDYKLLEAKYYNRSADSNFDTMIVHHFRWPCLMVDGRVMSKGIVFTERLS